MGKKFLLLIGIIIVFFCIMSAFSIYYIWLTDPSRDPRDVSECKYRRPYLFAEEECIYGFAAENNDPNICYNNLNDSFFVDQCLSEIAVKTSNITYCENMLYLSRSMCFRKYAYEHGIEYCERLEPDNIQSCKEDVMNK